jgi:DNA-binding response OmpR family regulator
LIALSKILIVEDDRLYGESITEYLEECGFEVLLVSSVQGAIKASFQVNFDLYIFDIFLQNENGIELLRELKLAKKDMTTLFLTSDPSSARAIECFDAGCTDYIRKSCDMGEIVARIQNALRAKTNQIGEYLTLESGHRYDFSAKMLSLDDEMYDLNPKEFLLLELLLSKRGAFVTLEEITDKLWASAEDPSFGSLRVYISSLKKILGKDAIKNSRGVGYKLVV